MAFYRLPGVHRKQLLRHALRTIKPMFWCSELQFSNVAPLGFELVSIYAYQLYDRV